MKNFFLLFLVILAGRAFVFGQRNTLDFYLNEAVKNSPLLADLENQAANTRLDSARIRAGYKPQVSGTSINSYAPVINGWGYDQAVSNGGNFSTLISANKTLVGNANLGSQFETLSLQAQTARNSAHLSEQELKRNVAAQYITAYGDMLQVNFTGEVYALLKKEESVLKRLTQQNVYKQADYLVFLVSLQQQNLQYRQWQIQFSNDLATLNYLCGIMDTARTELAVPAISVSDLPDIFASEFYRKYAIDSLKLQNDHRLIDFGYKAKVNLFADAGFSSSMMYLPYRNFGTSFGFSVSVPIYDGKQRKIQHDKIVLEERTRSGYQSFFLRQYHQQIAQYRQQLQATEELIGEINEQIRYAEGLITVNGKLLETGDVKMADYLIALSNYLNARNLLNQNKITRLQIINQLNYWNR